MISGVRSDPKRIFEYFLLLLGFALLLTGIYTLASRFRWMDTASSDLRQDYYAAKSIIDGGSIYELEEVQNYHPPMIAVFFLPLAYLPFPSAALLWAGLSVFCLYFSIHIILRELGLKIPNRWKLPLIGGFLCWSPIQEHIALGQYSIILMLCLVIGWVALRRDKQLMAGLAIGIAGLLKLYPLLLVIYLIVRKKYLSLVGLAMVWLVSISLTYWIVGPQDIYEYLTTIAPQDIQIFGAFPVNLSLYGLLARSFTEGAWFDPLIESKSLFFLFGLTIYCALLIHFLFLLYRLPEGNVGDDFGFGLGCILMILLSPVMWLHAAVLLLLPMGLLIKYVSDQIKTRISLLILLAVLLLSIPNIQISRFLMDLYYPYRAPWHAGLLVLGNLLGVLLVYGMVCFLIWHFIPITQSSKTETS